MKRALIAIMAAALALAFSAHAYAAENGGCAAKAADHKIRCESCGNAGELVSSGKAGAVLCTSCYNYKGGKDHCIKCGTWLGGQKGGRAILCSSCYNYKGGKDHCLKCGTWTSSNTCSSYLCKSCYDYKGGKNHCIRCGAWTP